MSRKIDPNKIWERMSKEDINKVPMRQYEGTIHIIKTAEEVDLATSQLEQEKILGFDTETRPAFRKGEHYSPALLQLGGEKAVFIFQLKQTGLPKPLLKILENPNIIKAGVSIKYDISELRSIADFEPGGFVELADRAKEVGIQNMGLRGMAAAVLGFRISKGASTSNWENRNLTDAQIKYAATDAWVGKELYLAIC